jgi:hypothetical protein
MKFLQNIVDYLNTPTLGIGQWVRPYPRFLSCDAKNKLTGLPRRVSVVAKLKVGKKLYLMVAERPGEWWISTRFTGKR